LVKKSISRNYYQSVCHGNYCLFKMKICLSAEKNDSLKVKISGLANGDNRAGHPES
jgi:hypothetical protein